MNAPRFLERFSLFAGMSCYATPASAAQNDDICLIPYNTVYCYVRSAIHKNNPTR